MLGYETGFWEDFLEVPLPPEGHNKLYYRRSCLFELLYPSNIRNDEYYIQCSLIPQMEGEYPSSKVEKLNYFCDTRSKEMIEVTKKQKFAAWYRPALRNKEGKAKAFTAVWLDIDVIKDKIDLVKLNNTLNTMPNPPSVIVWSGGGYHLYWLLDELETDMEIGKAAIAGLAEAVGVKCDPQQLDWGVSQGGLRIPGSNNWKWNEEHGGTKCDIQVINQKDGEVLRYSLDELPKKFDDTKKTGKIGTKRAKIEVNNAAEIFAKYFPNEDTSKEQWCVSCPFHDDQKASLSINHKRGMWTCRSEKHEGPKFGGVVSFYAHMENISIAQAMRELKLINKNDDAMVEAIQEMIQGSFEPLYQDMEFIVGHNKETLEICQIDTSSNIRLINSLASILRGSPEQIAKAIVSAEFHDEKILHCGFRCAVHNLLQHIPSKSNLTVLGQGIHHTTHNGKDITLLVDGRDMYQFNYKTMEWDKEEKLPILGQFLPKEGDKWYPFWKKEWGSVRAPKEVYQDIYEIVSKGWAWQNDLDPHLISLFTCYVWYFGWFGRPLSIFITGRSHSGKSALSEGLFAGNRHGSTGLVAGSMEFKDSSLAGFFQSASHQSRLVIFDELYDSKSKAAQEIIGAMRNLDAQNNKVVRGTKHGKPIEFPLNFPAVWSAIKSPELEQDANRQIFIIMKRKAGAIEPWMTISKMRTKDQLERLRAELPLFLLSCRSGVVNSQSRIQDAIVESGKVEYRKGQQLLPLLTIADTCGLDINVLMNLMTERAESEDAEIKADSFDNTLMTIIMQQDIPSISLDDGTPLVRVSVSEKIRNGHDFSCPNYGMYYRHSTKTLYISAPMILNNWIGGLPRFRDLTERSLANLFRTMPGYDGSASVFLGQDNGTKRCHKFNVDVLMEQFAEATENAESQKGLLI